MTMSSHMQARPRWVTLIGRILLGLVVLLLLLGGAILTLGMRAKADLKAKYPPPGQMVDVGGYRLHLACQGTGSPTVVMDSGLGDPSLLWGAVPAEVAAFTQVCVYDRAGLGWSDPSPRPRLAPEIVDELHRALRNAGIAGPYLLVGHSLGGIHARLYAHTYPAEVAGMVLVDSAHEEQLLRFPKAVLAVNTQLEDNVRDNSGLRESSSPADCSL